MNHILAYISMNKKILYKKVINFFFFEVSFSSKSSLKFF